MKKKELMKIRKLRATGEIMALAAADVPEKVGGYWRGTPCQRYQNGLYLRCEVQRGILHAAVYLTEYLRMGSRKAAFDLYIDREQRQFLTCQCETGKWLAAKLDMLPWPFYVHCSEGKWISGKDYELIRQYLKGHQGGFPGLLEYQLQVRKEELHRKYRRQIERWDADLGRRRNCQKTGTDGFIKPGFRKTLSFTDMCAGALTMDTVPGVKRRFRSGIHVITGREDVRYAATGSYTRPWENSAQ